MSTRSPVDFRLARGLRTGSRRAEVQRALQEGAEAALERAVVAPWWQVPGAPRQRRPLALGRAVPTRDPGAALHPQPHAGGRASAPHPPLRDTWKAEPQPAETRAGFVHAKTSHPSLLGLSSLLKWMTFFFLIFLKR